MRKDNKAKNLISQGADFIYKLLFDPKYFSYFTFICLIWEALICTLSIEFLSKYREMDWKAYVEIVEYFLKGDLNYDNHMSYQGPSLYPAGFTYIFSFLTYITDNGTNIKRARYIFAGFYLLQTFTVLKIYGKV
jgi:alpha-1,3-mannosyltransferase